MPWKEKGKARFGLARFNFTGDGELSNNIPEPLPNKTFSMLICGKPGSGKTNLLLNLFCRKKELYNSVFDRVFLISPSQKTWEQDWFESLPDEQRFYEYSEQILDDIVNQIKDSGDKVVIIIDDCVNDLTKNCRPLLRLLHNRRHICGKKGSVSILITAQVMNKVPLELRKSFSHILSFPFSSKKEQQSVFDDYISMDKDEWESLCRKAFEEPHDILMIDLYKNKFFRNFVELGTDERDEDRKRHK